MRENLKLGLWLEQWCLGIPGAIYPALTIGDEVLPVDPGVERERLRASIVTWKLCVRVCVCVCVSAGWVCEPSTAFDYKSSWSYVKSRVVLVCW